MKRKDFLNKMRDRRRGGEIEQLSTAVELIDGDHRAKGTGGRRGDHDRKCGERTGNGEREKAKRFHISR